MKLETRNQRNTMSILLQILLFCWMLDQSVLAEDSEYNVITLAANWTTAEHICGLNQRLLLPDLGLEDLKMFEIFSRFDAEELIWINAKNVEIVYSSSSAYLKFAYQPADFKLTSYLCHNALSGETKRNSSTLLSWKEAQKVCNSSAKWTLYNVSTPRQAKGTVSLLKKDVTFWVDKTSNHKIPNMVNLNMKEECIGVMKLPDGTLEYRRDNCTNKHKYVCVSSVEAFAPTITKMTQPFPFFSEEPEPESGNTTVGTMQKIVEGSGKSKMSGSKIGGIVGGTLGGVLVIVVAVGILYYVRRRWRSRRDYLRSLHRYTQRHASSRTLLEKTVSGPLPMNSCYTNNESVHINNPEEYEKLKKALKIEECEKRQYAQCQNDVVRDIKTRYAKYPSPHDSAALNKLPAYHSMDGKNKLQVLEAYETYDPDFGRLQQAHGYVNKQNQPQLSDLEQYDNIPKLPEKKGKTSALDDLEQYENQSAGKKRIVGKNGEQKHLGDTDRKTVSSLDELEQYENYQVPKREKGLFRLFKTEKANQAKKASEEAKRKATPTTLQDLEDYENYESQETARKEVKQLDDLDAYENYAVKKI
ncbi:uncharacterized protein LOC123561416 isoform X2 [Mercenaria mercenaria]|uniref:uncharacterized protein LOC123561416 isoform X2 n=1 Tax=Mercenaria mercenaria TaxID=6596 RepID=UPI00234E54B1|nr:uncharacterized protein LOC123561416 isoform X2 [Mercenaria mercenaria]